MIEHAEKSRKLAGEQHQLPDATSPLSKYVGPIVSLQVSRVVEDIAVATMVLIAEVDNTMEIEGGKKSWSSVQKVMSKPGHFINAMRRFPYAVDSGRIPDSACTEVRRYLQAGAQPEPDAHTVAQQAHQWLNAAYNYFQLRKKTPSLQKQGSAPGATTNSTGGYTQTPPKSRVDPAGI